MLVAKYKVNDNVWFYYVNEFDVHCAEIDKIETLESLNGKQTRYLLRGENIGRVQHQTSPFHRTKNQCIDALIRHLKTLKDK